MFTFAFGPGLAIAFEPEVLPDLVFAGGSHECHAAARRGGVDMPRPRVQYSAEFRRIVDLPRRVLSLKEGARLSKIYTEQLRTLNGAQILRPEQAVCVHELKTRPGRGAVFWLPTSAGKTLLAFLACGILTQRGERAVVLGPKNLLPQTLDRFGLYARHWKQPEAPIRYIPTSMITSGSCRDVLFKFKPKAIIFDEADTAANYFRTLARSIDQYKREFPETCIVSMTATPIRFSLMACWHHLIWALGDEAPVPQSLSEAKMWASVVDESVRDELSRPHPGALGPTRDAAVKWLARRIRETPGVVLFDRESCRQGHVIRFEQAPQCSKIDQAFELLHCKGRNPGGVVVTDSLSYWRLENQLGCGFYTEYDEPLPPERWIKARRALGRFVRRQVVLTWSSAHPLLTTGAVIAHFKSHPIIQEWSEVKSFRPKMRTVWFSENTLRGVESWAERQTRPAIIWCGSVDFAKCLASRTGLPFYGAGGLASGGKMLHRAAETERHIICSWNSAKLGFDLPQWSDQLIVMPPQSGKWLEQWLGRIFRSDQYRTVHTTIYVTSGIILDMFDTSKTEAMHVRNMVSLTQKILRARIEMGHYDNTSYRWASGNDRRDHIEES